MGGTASRLPLRGQEVDFIKNEVQSNRVVIFSKTSCPYCHNAKSLLSNLGVNFMVHELDQRSDGPKLQDTLETMTGTRTVPRVFINGKCTGGFSELQDLQNTGRLRELLG